jgi:hypothetical protein
MLEVAVGAGRPELYDQRINIAHMKGREVTKQQGRGTLVVSRA